MSDAYDLIMKSTGFIMWIQQRCDINEFSPKLINQLIYMYIQEVKKILSNCSFKFQVPILQVKFRIDKIHKILAPCVKRHMRL